MNMFSSKQTLTSQALVTPKNTISVSPSREHFTRFSKFCAEHKKCAITRVRSPRRESAPPSLSLTPVIYKSGRTCAASAAIYFLCISDPTALLMSLTNAAVVHVMLRSRLCREYFCDVVVVSLMKG